MNPENVLRANAPVTAGKVEIGISKDWLTRQAAISVEKGSFSWTAGGTPTLRNISFSVSSGTLVAVVGPVFV
jgi:hypothetical protein